MISLAGGWSEAALSFGEFADLTHTGPSTARSICWPKPLNLWICGPDDDAASTSGRAAPGSGSQCAGVLFGLTVRVGRRYGPVMFAMEY